MLTAPSTRHAGRRSPCPRRDRPSRPRDAPRAAECGAPAGGGRRTGRRGLEPEGTGARRGRARGRAVERKCSPVVAARRADEGLARSAGYRARRLRGCLRGSCARDGRPAGGMERGPVADASARAPGVRPRARLPARGLAGVRSLKACREVVPRRNLPGQAAEGDDDLLVRRQNQPARVTRKRTAVDEGADLPPRRPCIRRAAACERDTPRRRRTPRA